MKSSLPKEVWKLARPITVDLRSATRQSAEVEFEADGQSTAVHPTMGPPRSMARTEDAWSRSVPAATNLMMAMFTIWIGNEVDRGM